MRQFETFCRRCGRKIIMTMNEKTGRWVPCDTDIRRYVPGGGPNAFVDPEGKIRYGKRTFSGNTAGEWGYEKHRADCAAAGRNAG